MKLDLFIKVAVVGCLSTILLTSGVGELRAETSVTKSESEPDAGELWKNNCSRCHNKRSPDKFSDAQWRIVVRHMRVRANLSGDEERKILEFLKSAN